jgi:hypothetical protein
MMNRIENYTFGTLVIEGKKYTKDLILYPNKVITNWWREEGHSLCMKDLEVIKENKPDILIIGTGAYGRMKIPNEIRNKIKDLEIKVIVKKSAAAVKKYNKLVDQGEDVALAVHLTC